jgi:hypothetical protein
LPRARRDGQSHRTTSCDAANPANGGWPTFCFSFAIMSAQNQNPEPGLQRDPDEWKTGDEPMTAAQRSYLETLCRDTDETFEEGLTKAEASKLIDELRERSPRLAGH